MSCHIVAIDGPSGTGKSSVALEIAKQLNFKMLNTGALYRCVAYVCCKENIDFENEVECVRIIKGVNIQFDERNNQRMFYNQKEILPLNLSSPEVNVGVIKVAPLPEVRKGVVSFFQEFVKKESGGFVVEGRDIGTIQFPFAHCKIFLTARVDVRAKRRALEQERCVNKITPEILEKVLKNIKARDESVKDFLIKADDAVEMDTSEMTKEEVIREIMLIVKEKMMK